MRLGTAFQITDDTLDYVAKEEELGKAIGQDLREGKLTLPLIRTMKKCTPEERAFIRKGIEEKDEATMTEINVLIRRYDGIPYALAKAKACIEEARVFLAPFLIRRPRRRSIPSRTTSSNDGFKRPHGD